MRAERRLVTACIVFLLSSVVSITSGSDRSHSPALNSVSVSSRPKTNASAAPSFLTSRDSTSAVDAIDHEGSNDEERSWREVLQDAFKAIEAAPSELDHLHPSKLFEQIDIAAENEKGHVAEKLTQWTKCAIKYHDRFHSFDPKAVVDSLQTKLNWNAEQLVQFFASLPHSSDIQDDHVFALQKAVGDRFSLDEMLPLWQKSDTKPREVYQMMSIPTESMLAFDGKVAATETDTFNKLLRWIAYADTFYGGSNPGAIFSLLAEFRQPEEMLILFTSLPDGCEQRAGIWQKMLYKSFTQIRSKLSEIWLELGKTPGEVYGLMLLDSRVYNPVDFLEDTKWSTMCDANMEWVLYTDEYMGRSIIFSGSDGMNGLLRKELIKYLVTDLKDNPVAAQQKIEVVDRLVRDHTVGLLLDAYPFEIPERAWIVELMKDEALAERMKDRAIAESLMRQTDRMDAEAVFFHSLRYYHTDWKARADRMQQQLLTGCSKETENVVFGLWLRSGLGPEDVYHMMPFASTERFRPVKERTKSEWRDFCEGFKQWLRYVDLCNGATITFGDDKVMGVLEGGRQKEGRQKSVIQKEELAYLLSDLQQESGRKELVRLLSVAARRRRFLFF